MWACSLNWINKVEVFGTEKNLIFITIVVLII